MTKSLQIVFRPRFTVHPAVAPLANPMLHAYLSSWMEVMPCSEIDEVDYEDWVENAAQLHHALVSARSHPSELQLFIEEHSVEGPTYKPVATSGCSANRSEDAFSAERPFILLGVEGIGMLDTLARNPHVTAPSYEDQRAASSYFSNPGFWSYAKRQMQLATYDDGECNVAHQKNLLEILKTRRDAGQESAFVKVNEVKAGAASIRLAGMSDRDLAESLANTFEWTLFRLAGRDNGFLIQDDVRMEHEYRVFVVDGNPVAGAGCIGEYTPLNNRTPKFDTATRRSRPTQHSADPVTDTPNIVAAYKAALPDIVSSLTSGNPKMRDFVVDLCLIKGEVAVVEVNPARNAGLYALDIGALVAARIERGMREVLKHEQDPQLDSNFIHHRGPSHKPRP